MSKNFPNLVASKVFSPDETFASVKLCSWWNSFSNCLLASLRLVGVTGFEPVTLRLSSACSNQLSYTPDRTGRLARKSFELVELRRFELLTYSLQSYRSTN